MIPVVQSSPVIRYTHVESQSSHDTMILGYMMFYLVSSNDTRSQIILDDEFPIIAKLICGAVSGAIAQSSMSLNCLLLTLTPSLPCSLSSVTYPLDVIRRRMQMKGAMQKEFPYHNTVHAITTIINNEGVTGLYKGMIPNLLKVAPSVGIAFVSYEFTKARLFGIPLKWR